MQLVLVQKTSTTRSSARSQTRHILRATAVTAWLVDSFEHPSTMSALLFVSCTILLLAHRPKLSATDHLKSSSRPSCPEQISAPLVNRRFCRRPLERLAHKLRLHPQRRSQRFRFLLGNLSRPSQSDM